MFVLITAFMDLSSVSASYGAEGKSNVFKFNPPDWTTYTHEVTKVKERNIGDGQIHKDTGKSKALVFIRKTDSGFIVRYHMMDLSLERDGKTIENPVFDLLANIDVRLYLDADGRLLSVEGYELVFDIIEKKFPPEVGQQLSKMINVEDLIRKEKAEWDGRFGNFIGIGFNIGDILLAVNDYSLPGGEELTYYTGMEFTGTEKKEGVNCVKVAFKYNTDADALASFINMKTEAFKASMDEVSDVEMQGEGLRLIDPETMLIYSESISRDILMDMSVPGKGMVKTHIKETEEHDFDYADGKFWFASMVGDPVFERLEKFKLDGLVDLDRFFVCAWVLDGEVNNGGFDQFYYSSSGDLALEAIEAFEAIGAHGRADIIRRANSVFPDGKPPKDMDERIALLDSMPESKKELLSSLNDEYYKIEENMDQLFFEYIRKNQEHFLR